MTEQAFRGVIYGASGVGKTRLAASACFYDMLYPTVIIDTYGGQISYNDYYERGMRKPYIINVTNFDGLKVAWNLIKDAAGLREKVGWDFKGLPKLVILDQITDLQRLASLAITKSEAGLPMNEPGVLLPKLEWPGYNRLLNTFMDSTGFFMGINGVHTLIICHEELEANGMMTVRLDGSSKQGIMGRANFVGRLVAASRCDTQILDKIASVTGKPVVNNVLFSYNARTFEGKNQYNTTQYFADPDASFIIDLIKGGSK